MVAFGWSAGDIAAAIHVIKRIVEAFDSTRGATKQYKDSCDFLKGVRLVLVHLESNSIPLPQDPQVEADMRYQVQAIRREFDELAAYLIKYGRLDSDSVASASITHKASKVTRTIRWGLHELKGIDSQVQKMKRSVLDSLTALEAWMTVDLRRAVDDLTRNLTGKIDLLSMSAQQQEASLSTASDMLYDINDHITSLTRASLNYKSMLDGMRKEDTENVNKVSRKLVDIESTQQELASSLQALTEYIKNQAQQNFDEDQKEPWQLLDMEGEEQSSALLDLEKITKSGLEALVIVHGVMGHFREIIGPNKKLDEVTEKFGGSVGIVDKVRPYLVQAGEALRRPSSGGGRRKSSELASAGKPQHPGDIDAAVLYGSSDSKTSPSPSNTLKSERPKFKFPPPNLFKARREQTLQDSRAKSPADTAPSPSPPDLLIYLDSDEQSIPSSDHSPGGTDTRSRTEHGHHNASTMANYGRSSSQSILMPVKPPTQGRLSPERRTPTPQQSTDFPFPGTRVHHVGSPSPQTRISAPSSTQNADAGGDDIPSSSVAEMRKRFESSKKAKSFSGR